MVKQRICQLRENMLEIGIKIDKKNQEKKMDSQISLLLNIPNVKILQTEIAENGDYIITVESTEPGTKCRKCGEEAHKLHGHDREIKIRHLPILGHRVYIRMRPLRYECVDCSDKQNRKKTTTTQRLEWYNSKNSLSRAYENHLLLSLVNSTLQDVSVKEQVGYDTIRGLLKHRIKTEIDWSEIETLQVLGIDEIALRKGHKDYAVIITARQSDGEIILLAVLADRKKKTVKAFLESIPIHLRATVHSVCSDMWDAYINAADEVFNQETGICEFSALSQGASEPSGKKVSIVIDRFHVAKSYRQAVDRLRKSEMRRLKQLLSEEEYKQLKGVLWALRKNCASLNEEEIALLDRLFAHSPKLELAYDLREDLTAIFDTHYDTTVAAEMIKEWRQRVLDSGLKCFDSFLTSLDNRLEQILNYFDRRLNSGFVEGLNNKIKVIKRRCYGIFDTKHLFQRLFLDLNGFRLFLPASS